MKVKSESEVAQSCPTPTDPMDCSLPGSSAHGIFQARVLEWGAIAFSSKPLDWSLYGWNFGSGKVVTFCLMQCLAAHFHSGYQRKLPNQTKGVIS